MPRGAVIFLEDVPENHNSSCISILIKTLKWQNVGQISTQFKKFHKSLRFEILQELSLCQKLWLSISCNPIS